ncbi:MAG: hypothetical protein LUE88_06250, partial [Clostridiales bacterium]|nr:hypothetical protein [Clostridiales bacterium]
YILLIIYFPINALSGYITIAASNLSATIDISAIIDNPELIEQFVTSSKYIKLATYNFLSIVVESVLSPFGAMAIIYMTKNCFEGKETDFKEALSVSFSNGFSFIASLIVFSICVGLLSMLFVIPGVILAVFWQLYLQAIVLDNCKGISSLKFSRQLVKGRWWRTFLYIIVFYCMSYLANYVISILFMSIETTYFGVVVSGLIISLVQTIFTAAKTVVYIHYQGNPVVKGKK